MTTTTEKRLPVPPCSVRPSTHTCSAAHLHLVTEYRLARENDEQRRDAEVGLYGPGTTEWSDWHDTHNMITFKDWLIRMRRQ